MFIEESCFLAAHQNCKGMDNFEMRKLDWVSSVDGKLVLPTTQ